MNRLLVVALALVTACGIGEVRVSGVVLERPGGDSAVLADGTVRVHDARGELFDTAPTDSLGRFDVAAPAGEVIYAIVENPDGVQSSFTGVSGLDPTMQVERGDLYGIPAALRAEWEATFEGCEGMGERGLVIGRVHVFLPGVEPDDSTIVNNATVKLQRTDTGTDLDRTTCYLDLETGLYDPDASSTGRLGMYAIPDVPTGQYILQIQFEITEGLFNRGYLDIRVPPSGIVPRFPTYVEFPLL